MADRYFSDKIVEWYEKNYRDLPWRQTNDPYRVWLSEIILQQTRVSQGLPYYLRFIEEYPTLSHLAAASEQQVLRLWQGLGYYSRARNLLKCARYIAFDLDGRFPATFDGLTKLPGIGDYTAAAIASFAFGIAVPVVDGNVFRVLARVHGIDLDISTGAAKKYFFETASALIDPLKPAAFNQGMMELGALVCKPVSPDCDACPVAAICQANARGIQHLLPVKSRATRVRSRYFLYLVLEHKGRIAFRKRTAKDIWEGLHDFPLIESKRPTRTETALKSCGEWADLLRSTTGKETSAVYRHMLSHQKIVARFIRIQLNPRRKVFPKGTRFYSARQIANLPKPRLIERYLTDMGIS